MFCAISDRQTEKRPCKSYNLILCDGKFIFFIGQLFEYYDPLREEEIEASWGRVVE